MGPVLRRWDSSGLIVLHIPVILDPSGMGRVGSAGRVWHVPGVPQGNKPAGRPILLGPVPGCRSLTSELTVRAVPGILCRCVHIYAVRSPELRDDVQQRLGTFRYHWAHSSTPVYPIAIQVTIPSGALYKTATNSIE